MNKIVAFMREEEGLTTVEYAIAGGLVGAAVITAFTNLGTQVGRIIGGIATALTAIADAPDDVRLMGQGGGVRPPPSLSRGESGSASVEHVSTVISLIVLSLAVRTDMLAHRIPNALMGPRGQCRSDAPHDSGRERRAH